MWWGDPDEVRGLSLALELRAFRERRTVLIFFPVSVIKHSDNQLTGERVCPGPQFRSIARILTGLDKKSSESAIVGESSRVREAGRPVSRVLSSASV